MSDRHGDQHGEEIPPREVASARLLVNLKPEGKTRWWQRVIPVFGSALGKDADAERVPEYIPNDGPADISRETLRAPLLEGDVFGEMSCLNRVPRSATVVVEQECYILEMLRNVLNILREDKAYRRRMDEVYRSRVLENQVRRFSVFRQLTDKQFEVLTANAQLCEYESGSVIFEQHEQPSDCFYVIRSGLVKVVESGWWRLLPSEMTQTHWSHVCGELAAGESADAETGPASIVWNALPFESQELVRTCAAGPDAENGDREALLAVWNAFYS